MSLDPVHTGYLSDPVSGSGYHPIWFPDLVRIPSGGTEFPTHDTRTRQHCGRYLQELANNLDSHLQRYDMHTQKQLEAQLTNVTASCAILKDKFERDTPKSQDYLNIL